VLALVDRAPAVPTANAHTHLELTGLSHLCPSEPTDFVPWLLRLGLQMSAQPRVRFRRGIEQGIAELEGCGTTHVGDVTATWLSVEPLLESALQGVVFVEVAGWHKRRALERLESAKAAIQKAQAHPRYGAMQVGLSLHAPYSCHPDLLRAGAAWCQDNKVPLCIHAAESPAETELLVHGSVRSAPWLARTMLRTIGVRRSRVRHRSPVAYLASLGVLAAHPLLVHAVQVTDDDVSLIADAGCAVVHCPRSNHRLRCGRMPLERFLAAGTPVYLGTDSRASSPNLNVRQEADFAQLLHGGWLAQDQVLQLVHQSFPHRSSHTD
jgi:cytosine/adenosine deaminase-related metal-dependent hydrolase